MRYMMRRFRLTRTRVPWRRTAEIAATVVIISALIHGMLKNDNNVTDNRLHQIALPRLRNIADDTCNELEKLRSLESVFSDVLTYHIYDATYPPYVDNDEWKRIYAPCATLRLFFPDVLPYLTHLIYVDSDTVWTRPPEQLWRQFSNFGSYQIMGASYDRIADLTHLRLKYYAIPQYSPGRLQSGVLLMHLARMRAFGWLEHVLNFAHFWRYKDNFTGHLFDQSAINVAFFFNPDKLYLIDCSWNFRPYHVNPNGHVCSSAERYGVSLVHGCQYAFHGEVYNEFTAFYWAFREYNFTRPREELVDMIKRNLKNALGQDSLNRSQNVYRYLTTGLV